ncbi:MAG: glycerophosphoryl diester phosphodiesterase [Legionellales bacterium]|nr:glycerophosphoryl diester phosphodiesterase [Legionellales bacterium]
MNLPFMAFWPELKLIAHRGASAARPENTLPALYAAHEMGAKWVEFDVVLSKDGQPFVFHDEHLERTTNGHGLVANTLAADLKKLDAGEWYSQEYKNTRIPTLSEWLISAAELGFAINLEIKPLDHRETLLVDVTLEELAICWSASLPSPLITCFSTDVLSYVRACSPNAKLGLLMHQWRDDWKLMANQLACTTVHLERHEINSERVREIHESNRFVLAYTVNDIKQAQDLLALGVDGVFSNHVEFLETLA